MDPLQQAKLLFLQAVDHHNRNRLQDAERLYRQALALAPDRASILTNLSALLLATGRAEQAQPLCHRVLELQPDNPVALEHLRACAHTLASPGTRREQLEDLLKQAPDDTHLLNAYALALLDEGRPRAAIDALQRAIAIEPSNAGLLVNLGLATEAGGQTHAALSHYTHALRLQPDLEAAGQAFSRLLLELGPSGDIADGELDGLLVRALRTPWIRPQSLAALVAARLQDSPALQACKRQAEGETGGLRVSRGITTEQRALAREALLLALLDSALVADPGLERMLTDFRTALLHTVVGAADGNGDEDDHGLLELAASLAMQCFHNGFVYVVGTLEMELLEKLSERVQALLDADSAPDPLAVAVLGCYVPLASLRGSSRLLAPGAGGKLPPALLSRQVEQPMREAALRAGIEVLTPVRDEVSRKVQAQYEEHPYPRWSGLPRRTHKVPLDQFIRRHVAGVDDLTLPDCDSGRFRVLNAGCGTGQNPIDLVLRVKDLDVLAIDLSRESLGYAKRMAADMGIDTIRFAQADILELGSVGLQFDLVESAGVLHHLQSPERGLAILRKLLTPKGLVRIALYSERARQSVAACRQHIAEFGYAATSEDIRRLRQHVLALPPDHPASSVAGFSDFYSLQECRDLLFHVQEHRFTLLEVGDILARQGLNFLGLQLSSWQKAAFLAHFGGESHLRSLEHWDAHERTYPDTFADMFVFWAQAQT